MGVLLYLMSILLRLNTFTFNMAHPKQLIKKSKLEEVKGNPLDIPSFDETIVNS